jgi:hypothetical protein
MPKFVGLNPCNEIRLDSDAMEGTMTCLDQIQAASAMEIAGRSDLLGEYEKKFPK